MNNIELAYLFMIKANKGKKFKFDDIDRSFHSVCVGTMLLKIDDIPENIVIAGILHDIINETDYGYEEIEHEFGSKIAEIVSDVSEDLSIAKWLERKKDFIRRIRKIDDPLILNIVVADKINYLQLLKRCIKDINKITKYSGGSPSENKYFYREIYNICESMECNKDLLNRYSEILLDFFDDVEF